MHHLLIAVAIFSFVSLDLVFVTYSDTPSAALVFGILSYSSMLLLSASAGTYAGQSGLFNALAQPKGAPLPARIVLAAAVPVALLFTMAYLQEVDSLVEPREIVRLGTTLAVFWLLAALALAGAFLGFFWPRTGPLESVVVGGLTVLAQGFFSHTTVDAGREAIQLSLYTWMVWITVCLAGAWAGMVMRQGIEYYFTQSGVLQTSPEGAGQSFGLLLDNEDSEPSEVPCEPNPDDTDSPHGA